MSIYNYQDSDGVGTIAGYLYLATIRHSFSVNEFYTHKLIVANSPRKALEAAKEWARTNNEIGHIEKIDVDTVLNAT